MPSVEELMTKDVVTIDLHKTVCDAAMLMNENRIGCLVVTDGTVPVGIVTERDFVRKVVACGLAHAHPLDMEVSDIMSKPLITIDPDSSIKEAARVMSENKIRRLPVVEENILYGIIVASDFARQLGKKTITEKILEAMARYPLEHVPRHADTHAYSYFPSKET